jgi:hypothetical protein
MWYLLVNRQIVFVFPFCSWSSSSALCVAVEKAPMDSSEALFSKSVWKKQRRVLLFPHRRQLPQRVPCFGSIVLLVEESNFKLAGLIRT